MKMRLLVVFTLVSLVSFLHAGTEVHSPKNVLGYWKYNGNYENSVNNKIISVPINTSFTSDRFGRPQSAVYFAGNAHIRLENLQITEPGITISYWVRFDAFPGYQISGFILSQGGYAFRLGISGQGQLFINGGWHRDVYQPFQFQSNIWYHMALTVDQDSKWTAYINGEKIISGTSGSIDDWKKIPYFGVGASLEFSPDNATHRLHGALDDFMIVNKALDPSEVRSLYDNK